MRLQATLARRFRSAVLRLRPSARYSHTSFSSVASHGSPLNSGGDASWLLAPTTEPEMALLLVAELMT